MVIAHVYVYENGLRKVLPYYVNCRTNVKQRWVGRTLLQVFTNDFGDSEKALKEDIVNKNLYVMNNVGTAQPSYCLKGWEALSERKIEAKDVIYYKQHRHEPNVQWHGPIKTVFEDENIIVVDKPCGIPTHPSGNYFYNSLSEIVKESFGLDSIWTCHRLDRVTSGVLIFCKNKETAVEFSNLFVNKTLSEVKKIYLARVDGKFPPGKLRYTSPTFSINMNGYIIPTNLAELQTNTTTLFERIEYNERLDQSIVKCQPITGKFHQIRIHLRNLGHPISNDKFYKPGLEAKTYRFKCELECELYARIFEKYPQFAKLQSAKVENSHLEEVVQFLDLKQIIVDLDESFNFSQRLESLKKLHSQHIASRKLSICGECNRSLFENDYISNSSIYLHSMSLEHGGKKYQTEPPSWMTIL